MSEPTWLKNTKARAEEGEAEVERHDVVDFLVLASRLVSDLQHIRTEAIRLRMSDPSPRHKWLANRVTRIRDDARQLEFLMRRRITARRGPKPAKRSRKASEE